MTTFAYDLTCGLNERWAEVELLIVKAQEQESSNNDFYNVLCRTTVILIVAHFEGFVKDVAKAILDDINKFSCFKDTPHPIKTTFCNLFIDIDQSGDYRKVNKLIQTFDGLDTKFELDPFLFENNKNPSPTIIHKISKRFGINDFFGLLDSSSIGDVFKNGKKENRDLLNALKLHVEDGVKEYPYHLDPSFFDITTVSKKEKESMWKTFLDQLLKIRHSIAHGTDFSNALSVTELNDYKQKIQILQYVFALVMFHNSNT